MVAPPAWQVQGTRSEWPGPYLAHPAGVPVSDICTAYNTYDAVLMR